MFFRDEEIGVSGKGKKDCVEGRKIYGPEDGKNKWRLKKLE
jgi:hypothetical protein